VPVEQVFYTESFASTAEGLSLLDRLSGLGAALLAVEEPVMQAMSDTSTPQGILAVLPVPRLQVPEAPTFVLISDKVSDPGNMGAIMRAAAGAGVPLLIVTAGTVDLTNPKVVRSAVGAHFRLPVQPLSWEGITNRLSGHVVFLADTRGGAPYYRVDWTQPCALIVSDEAHGPSLEAQRVAHARVTIPMPGGIESLNVAMAATVLMFEMVRQRSEAMG
jgi:TrmH family RNA methyltransferase